MAEGDEIRAPPVMHGFLNPIPPKPFDLHSPEPAERWEDWKLEFSAYADSIQLFTQPKTVQRGIFLRTIGLLGHKTFNTFTFDSDDDRESVPAIIAKFDERFAPDRNEAYETLLFRQRIQSEGEGFNEWITDLRIRATTCNFGEFLDRCLRDQIIFGIKSPHTRQQMYKRKKRGSVVSNCRFCGLSHDRGACPAYGQPCDNCGKLNHYARVCQQRNRASTVSATQRSRAVHPLAAETSEANPAEIEYLQITTIDTVVNSRPPKVAPWTHTFQTPSGKFVVKLDSGADCNVMSRSTARRLQATILSPNATVLRAFGGQCIRPVGTTVVTCQHDSTEANVFFQVIDQDAVSILGRETCAQLGLLVPSTGFIQVLEARSDTSMSIVTEFADCFEGLGNFGSPHTIRLKPGCIPVNRPARPVPVALYPKVREKLKQMEDLGIIEPVSVPTEWCSALTTTLKPDGTIRVCIDPVDLKAAILRPTYPMQTLEGISARMPQAKFFTVLDASTGFWQIPLDEESSWLVTFSTPFGRYRYKRLPFGIPDAPEVFQRRAAEFISDLEGVEDIVDDFLIWGRTIEEHDQHLRAFFLKARKHSLKLKREKVQLAQTEVKFSGHILSSEGLRPDPGKIAAIIDMPTPTDKPAVQRIIGMVAYLQKFIPNASQITAPLRAICQPATFEWTEEAEKAFIDVKQALSSTPVLKLYDVMQPVIISADASSHGTGAVLLQRGQPVAYTSRALTPTQRNYAQIEKELLAVVHASQRFDSYIFGKVVVVQTDHKPLEVIFKKPLSVAPARLQRMLMALQRYHLEVQYVPGKNLSLPDALSRAHSGEAEELPVTMHVCLVTSVSTAKWNEFREQQMLDSELITLRQATLDGWPCHKQDAPLEIHSYWNLRDTITIHDEVLMSGDRIIVPKSMRSAMLQVIHEGHLGAELSKRRARTGIYWPGMGASIEQMVGSCIHCQHQRAEGPREEALRHEVPTEPFTKVAVDFFELDSVPYLILVDYTSAYIVVRKVTGTATSHLIAFCRQVFETHGIPRTFMSDNGPQFTSAEFTLFAQALDMQLLTSSPHYPRSNGLVERAVRTVKKLLRASSGSNCDHQLAMLNLNSTPRDYLQGKAPAEILMGRRPRTRLPTCTSSLNKFSEKGSIPVREERAKGTHDLPRQNMTVLTQGQSVWLKLRKNHWVPAMVVRQLSKPRSYLVRASGVIYHRNRQHLAPRPRGAVPPDIRATPAADRSTFAPDDDDEDDVDAHPSTIDPPEALLSGEENPDDNINEAEPGALRRSTRNRKTPGYLKDFILQ